MGGGLIELVAYGAQDIYLTGNPQITFFKVVYRRHTNFSMESIQQTVSGTSILKDTISNGSVTISRNGDLLSNVYVKCNQDTTHGIYGFNIIKSIELEIGGQRIDKQDDAWRAIWNELTLPESKIKGYKYMTGAFTNNLVTNNQTKQQSLIIPLTFWFCRNPGLAIPLIALQYHEVKFNFEWNTKNSIARDENTLSNDLNCEVWGEYIYLDTDERRRFAQTSHEYLIEQVQFQNEGQSKTRYSLNFNHPVKEIIWVNISSVVTTQTAKITMNGNDRFEAQSKEYFQLYQPFKHHTNIPSFNVKESEGPELLLEPKNVSTNMLTSEADTSVSSNGMAVISNILYLHSDQEMDSFKVGDILHITEIDLNADSTGGFNIYAHITKVTSTTQFTLNGCPNTTAGNFGSISKIGGVQNESPKATNFGGEINVYSFSLNPEEHQPSGTCNFSRIDSCFLEYSSAVTIVYIYAVNYNVLRIMSGMGGLAYSN